MLLNNCDKIYEYTQVYNKKNKRRNLSPLFFKLNKTKADYTQLRFMIEK